MGQSFRLRPHRLLLALVVPSLVLALAVHRAFAVIGGVGLIILWGFVLADIRARRQEVEFGHE